MKKYENEINRRHRRIARKNLVNTISSLHDIREIAKDFNLRDDIVTESKDPQLLWEFIIQEVSHKSIYDFTQLLRKAQKIKSNQQIERLLAELLSPASTTQSQIKVSNKLKWEYKTLSIENVSAPEIEKKLDSMGSEGWEMQGITNNLVFLRRSYRVFSTGNHVAHGYINFKYLSMYEYAKILTCLDRIQKAVIYKALSLGEYKFRRFKKELLENPEILVFDYNTEKKADFFLSECFESYNGSILEISSVNTGNSLDWFFRLIQFGAIYLAQDLPLWKDLFILTIECLIAYQDIFWGNSDSFEKRSKKRISFEETEDSNPIVELMQILKSSETIKKFNIDVGGKSKWSMRVDFK